MKCRDFVLKLSQYIDGELAQEECEKLRAHMRLCESCDSFFKSFTNNIELCKQVLKDEIPKEIKNRLKDALHSEYKKLS